MYAMVGRLTERGGTGGVAQGRRALRRSRDQLVLSLRSGEFARGRSPGTAGLGVRV